MTAAERLVTGQRNGALLLVGGDGSTAIYESSGRLAWRAPAGWYRDTIYYGPVADPIVAPGTYYWRRDLDLTRRYYDGGGRLRYIVDRLGRHTELTYADTSAAAGIATIIIPPNDAPNPIQYRFRYAGGVLDSIIDPAGRALDVSVQGNVLRQILQPGLPAANYVAFDYSGNVMERRRSPRLQYTNFRLADGTSLLVKSILPTGDTIAFLPQELMGFSGTATVAPAALSRTDSVMTQVNGPRRDVQDVTTFRLVPHGAARVVRDALGDSIVLTRSDSNVPFAVTSARLADGRSRRAVYDARGRLTEWYDSASGGRRRSTRYVYSQAAPESPQSVYRPRPGGGDDTTSYSYTANGLLNSVRDPRGHQSFFRYDNRGQLNEIIEATVAVFSGTYVTGSARTTADSVRTRLLHGNRLANTDTIIGPSGERTTIRFDTAGRVTNVIDPVQASTWYAYHPMNWLAGITVYEDDGTPRQMQYFTDEEGNVTRQVTPRNHSRYWTYDALGRRSSMTDERGGIQQWRYDPAGNLLATFNRHGDSVWHRYDAVGRMTHRYLGAVRVKTGEEALYRASAGQLVARGDTTFFHYDALGRDTAIENRAARVTRRYTAFGELEREVQLLKFKAGSPSYVHSYSYWDTGHRRTYTTPGNRSTTYTYAKGPVLASISMSGLGAFSFRWDAMLRPDSIGYPNSSSIRYYYDQSGRTRWVYAALQDSVFTDLRNTLFDDRGTLLHQSSFASRGEPAGFHRWGYTRRGFMKADTSITKTITYQYDANGNMTEARASSTDYTKFYIAATSDLLAAMGEHNGPDSDSTTFFYDRDGNRTVAFNAETGTPRYTLYHDAAGRLTGSKRDTAVLIVDGVGRQVGRIWGPGHRTFQYDGASIAGVDGVAEFVHGPTAVDHLLAALYPSATSACLAFAGPASYFYAEGERLLDHRGATGSLCMSDAYPVWEQYAKYAGGIMDSFTFGAQRNPEPMGSQPMADFRNRWYDPSTGRFAEEDPLGYLGELNLYSYAGNSPATYTDPFGLCPEGQMEVKGECVQILAGAPPLVTPSSAIAGAARVAGAVGAGVRGARIISQARTILGSAEFATLRAAAQSGASAEVQIAGRTIVYEPGLTASGMTLFGESGFVLGRQAFSSSRELVKTVLHELHRLNTSAAASGVSGASAAAETAGAAGFADRAYQVGRLLGIW